MAKLRPLFMSKTFKVDTQCPIIDFLIFPSFRICIFSVGFYFDSTLILWTLAFQLCMAIGARPHVCGVL
jgi:uncharacterized membrane protein